MSGTVSGGTLVSRGLRFGAFALALVLTGAAGAAALETTLVAPGSTWTYLDDGSDQGTSWTAPAFDDSGWSAGPAQLGYGDGDEATVVSYGPNASNKFITTYFRHSFSVADPSAFTFLILNLLRDDGAVVHLNGSEVFRSNMPAGTIVATTTASTTVGGADESTFFTATLDPAGLVAGSNVLAVEIHQRDPTSSDISFDLELIGSDAPAQVSRGPYLQRAAPDGVVVRWRTNIATDSRVRYGPSPGDLSSTADDGALTTEHVVAIAGLSADTRYYYSVGTSTATLAGGDAGHSFVTSPPPGTAKPTRVWVVGDSGTADANARAVRDAYFAFTGSTATDLWLMLGDNAYDSGTDAEYQAAVFDTYPSLLRTSVVWPTLGNHDAASADSATQSGVYYDIFTLPAQGEAGGEASGTEAYYSFDYGNIHFICLDSEDSSRAPGGAMLTWLELDLQSTTADWIIAFWHHPPYSKGSHDSDFEGRLIDMRQNALPILESYGVDLVLAGHSHSYERSILLDGHYGASSSLTGSMIVDGGDGRTDGDGAYHKPGGGPVPNGGAVYTVAGSSGQTSGGALNHPVMYVSLNELGSVVLDVDGGVLNATFLNASGTVRDHFTLVKDEPLCPPAPEPGCRTATHSVLAITDAATEKGDRLAWRWRRGQATTPQEFGDPTTDANYALCLYDQRGAALEATAPAGAAHWRLLPGGRFRYRDPDAVPSGIAAVLLKPSDTDTARIVVRGKGTALADAPLPLVLPVTAQLFHSDTGLCWEATFTEARRNHPVRFRAVRAP